MKAYVATNPDGQAITYVDRKRYLWLSSVLFPLQPFIGIALHAFTGQQAWLLLPILLSYGVLTVSDWLVGEDQTNPPEAFVDQLEQDRYYRWLTYLVVPLHFASLVGATWWAGTQSLDWWAYLGLALVAGMTSGLGINTGHELGHKNSRIERWLGKIVLAVPAYGHFTIEHNRGHHRDVATPEDPASSRMGESVYRFARREMPGAFRRAWEFESDRLQRRGRSAWHPDNNILQAMAITLALQLGLLIAFGITLLPFLLIHNAFAWWQLTSANYIEHYGLLRRQRENGRFEPCAPHHSWNSNHTLSNLVLFHLQRHSDHHTHPLRRYQSLRHFDDLPTLPNGYPGCYLMAWVPPLWFRVMNPRLLALSHVKGDLTRVNIEPSARADIEARYSAA